ncbi:MAG: DUF5689 domain-containing protein, partial [Flavobacterium sp.]|nr:DUF5689 domain-containing protein [Flavobacterium sp.]
KSNTTIAGLKAMYSGGLDSIKTDIIIQGIIVANDESGNYYKTMIIQDHTAGIELKVDKTNLYTEYRLGQRVFIKCKGLYLGNYGNLVQLGYIFNGAIGRIPSVFIDNHFFKDSLPSIAPVPALRTISALSSLDLSTLIKIDSLEFTDNGQVFAPSTAEATSRKAVDKLGNVIEVRSSKYANFAATKLPEGIGSLIGVYSIYNGIKQFTIRDINDVKNFIPEPVLWKEKFDVAPTNWVIFSVASNKDWAFDATTSSMSANGFGGDVGSDDWLISPAVTLNGYVSYDLVFSTWTRYSDTGNPTPFEAFVSQDYSGSGDPSQDTWVKLPATLSPTNSQLWTSSGSLSLNAYANKKIYIAFRYKSSGVGSSTASNWKVDNVKIMGTK